MINQQEFSWGGGDFVIQNVGGQKRFETAANEKSPTDTCSNKSNTEETCNLEEQIC